jgi:hypothetical protein
MENKFWMKLPFSAILIMFIAGCSNPTKFEMNSAESLPGVENQSPPTSIMPPPSASAPAPAPALPPPAAAPPSQGSTPTKTSLSVACVNSIGLDLSKVAANSQIMTDYCNCVRCGFITQAQAGISSPNGGNIYICSAGGYTGVWALTWPQCIAMEVNQFPWQSN